MVCEICGKPNAKPTIIGTLYTGEPPIETELCEDCRSVLEDADGIEVQ